MRFSLFILLILGWSTKLNSQTFPIVIKGQVVDKMGVGVTDCYIKVSNKKSGIVYSYFNAGDKNVFSVEVEMNSVPDSIVITVSHVSYANTIIEKIVLQDTKVIFNTFTLLTNFNKLDQVTVKAPPVWVRGDTTFFKVDAFTEGEEKKLKDLISKMPGFEITDEGQLLYKKKLVEKIMVDGAEIFADKLDLMLNNFPVHVLNTVQAIENQNNSRLLKGLTSDNKVFINLGLNKAKLKAAFGDGEVGIGTQSRYSISPVLFSLFGKIKGAFIGNWNSIGNGISWKQENEIKQEEEKLAQHWLMTNHPLQLINNFESRWYIRNQQWDNRLQINAPITKKVKSQTELSFIKDRQAQNTFYNSFIFYDSSFRSRNDSNSIIYRPLLLNLRQAFTYSIDSAREFQIHANIYEDVSKSFQYSKYNQNGSIDILSNSVKNKWNSVSAKINFTHRLSPVKAREFNILFNSQNVSQKGTGVAKDYSEIFEIADSSLTNLFHNVDNRVYLFRGGLKETKKSSKGLRSMEISFQTLKVSINTNALLRDSAETLVSEVAAINNNPNEYTINELKFNYEKSIKLILKKPFQIQGIVGAAHTSIKEDKNTEYFVTPLIDISLHHQHELFNFFKGLFDVRFSHQQVKPYQLQRSDYPASINSFQRFANISSPVKRITTQYGFAWNWPSSLSSGYLGLSYNKQFSAFAPVVRFNRFFQFSTDSLVNNSIDNYNVSTSHTFPSLLIKALINADAGFASYNNLLSYNGEVVKNPYTFYYISLSLKKNWQRKYFIKLVSRYTAYRLMVPSGFKGGISNNVSNLYTLFSQRLQIKKNINIVANLSMYQNNIFSTNKSSFVFADMECNLKLKNQPLFFSVRIENLTNQKNFQSFNNSNLIQSFYSVPLIPRSIFAGVRFNF